jgi:hypothetical protein
MVWAKFDDETHTNRKLARLSDAAFRLWSHSITFSAKHGTDGMISEADVPLVWPSPSPSKRMKAVRELVENGNWDRTPGGWRIHDFLDYQPTAQEAASMREDRSDSGSLGAHRRWHESRGVVKPGCAYCKGDSKRHSDRDGVQMAVPGPVPEPEQDAGSSDPGVHGIGGVRGGNADFDRTLRTVAEEHADRRITEGYDVRKREGYIRNLMKSDEVRNEAMKRTPASGNVRELLDRIGKPIDGEEAIG